MLDITDADTMAYIAECVNALPEREKLIIEKLGAGLTYKEIGTSLCVSSSAVHQIIKHAGAALRRMAKSRRRQLYKEELKQLRVCSIFRLDPVTYETLRTFEQAVAYLVENYHVSAFLVQQNYCYSGYMASLKKIADAKRLPVIAAVSYPEMPEKQMKEIKLQFCPPCNSVENVIAQNMIPRVRNMYLIKEMINRSQYCICSLSDTSFDKSIRIHIAKMKGRIVLNIRKKQDEPQ